MFNTTERAHLAALHYLKLTDRKIIYSNFLDRFIVAEDDGGLAFIDVFCTYDGMSNDLPSLSRDVFEDAIYKFFYQEHEPIDVPVRYDTIEIFVVGNERAIIRHHINAELEG